VIAFLGKLRGQPRQPAHLLELLKPEQFAKEQKKKMQEAAVGRLLSGVEWADEEVWVSS
jgi:hypothetical protein